MTFGPPPPLPPPHKDIPPQLPPPRRRSVALFATGVVLGAAVLSAAVTGLIFMSANKEADKAAPPAVTVSPSPTPSADDTDDGYWTDPEPTPETSPWSAESSRMLAEYTWDQDMDEDQKSDMCIGIGIFGVDWAADAMRDGGDTTTDDIDWDAAADAIKDKCIEEGFM